MFIVKIYMKNIVRSYIYLLYKHIWKNIVHNLKESPYVKYQKGVKNQNEVYSKQCQYGLVISWGIQSLMHCGANKVYIIWAANHLLFYSTLIWVWLDLEGVQLFISCHKLRMQVGAEKNSMPSLLLKRYDNTFQTPGVIGSLFDR